MNKLSQAYNYHTLPKAKPVSTECNFCNNTSEHCCPESDKNYEAQAHIIDAQDEHHHDEADAHVFMMNSLLVAKDVAMPKAGV